MILLIILFAICLYILIRCNSKERYEDTSVSTNTSNSDACSTCQLLSRKGFGQSDIQEMALSYTNACGDASNTGFAMGVINSDPYQDPIEQQGYVKYRYGNAMPSLPPQEGGYCETPIACGAGGSCPSGYGISCQHYNAQFGQPQPACF